MRFAESAALADRRLIEIVQLNAQAGEMIKVQHL